MISCCQDSGNEIPMLSLMQKTPTNMEVMQRWSYLARLMVGVQNSYIIAIKVQEMKSSYMSSSINDNFTQTNIETLT